MTARDVFISFAATNSARVQYSGLISKDVTEEDSPAAGVVNGLS